jgi:hypothetical protein
MLTMMTRKLIVWYLVGLALCLGVGIYASYRFFQLSTELDGVNLRLSKLENSVHDREQADPLTPAECAVNSGSGETRSRPCHTTFDRLLRAPHQFHGRWIVVSGLYISGFEQSALHPLNFEELSPSILNHHSAIWISLQSSGENSLLEKRTFIGRFQNGPAGHLHAYFGELLDAAAFVENRMN